MTTDPIECPVCGVRRTQPCLTKSGADHVARRRVLRGEPTEADEQALQRRYEEEAR